MWRVTTEDDARQCEWLPCAHGGGATHRATEFGGANHPAHRILEGLVTPALHPCFRPWLQVDAPRCTVGDKVGVHGIGEHRGDRRGNLQERQ